jgi:antirestriction protein ArdC
VQAGDAPPVALATPILAEGQTGKDGVFPDFFNHFLNRNIMTKQSKPNLYQTVTNRIIEKLEQGVAPWRRTWSRYGLARNYASKHIYTGINMVLMNMTEHPIPYFMTFNQVRDHGGKVRKGSKAEQVVYFNFYYKDANDRTLTREQASAAQARGQEIQILKFIKHYPVFNIADIEGIEFEIPEVTLRDNEQINACEQIIAEMPNCPDFVTIDADQPFYSPTRDVVNMPSIKQFETSQAYYATCFHELAHSTGHPTRLNREGISNPQGFGSKSYSQEELIAEMAAAFVCAKVDIDVEPLLDNSASYLAGWLKVLKEDNRFIFHAAAEAQKAADYILGM